MLLCATEVNNFPSRTEPEKSRFYIPPQKIKQEFAGGFYILKQTQMKTRINFV